MHNASTMMAMLMSDAVHTSQKALNFYQTTRRNIPKDCYLHSSRRENPKSQLGFLN
jgi:hypothetical protein